MSYLIGYSIGRFWVEGLRTDSLAFDGPAWLHGFMEVLWSPMRLLFEEGSMDYGNVRTSQLLAVILIIGAIAHIVYYRRTSRSVVLYSDPIVPVSATGVEAEVAEDSAAPSEQAEGVEPAGSEDAEPKTD
jgi:phosphatidylglycerol:prolipoprotein diacylglycerol transferase